MPTDGLTRETQQALLAASTAGRANTSRHGHEARAIAPGTVPGLEDYQDRVAALDEELKSLPTGRETASDFEDIVGDVLRLCFFKTLGNVQPEQRDHEGVVRRDWVASIRTDRGFWATMRQRYKATQVIFECKNYRGLEAKGFHHATCYLTDQIDGIAFIAYGGKSTRSGISNTSTVAYPRVAGAIGRGIVKAELPDQRPGTRQSAAMSNGTSSNGSG